MLSFPLTAFGLRVSMRFRSGQQDQRKGQLEAFRNDFLTVETERPDMSSMSVVSTCGCDAESYCRHWKHERQHQSEGGNGQLQGKNLSVQ